jgi:hypothetical protein
MAEPEGRIVTVEPALIVSVLCRICVAVSWVAVFPSPTTVSPPKTVALSALSVPVPLMVPAAEAAFRCGPKLRGPEGYGPIIARRRHVGESPTPESFSDRRVEQFDGDDDRWQEIVVEDRPAAAGVAT